MFQAITGILDPNPGGDKGGTALCISSFTSNTLLADEFCKKDPVEFDMGLSVLFSANASFCFKRGWPSSMADAKTPDSRNP